MNHYIENVDGYMVGDWSTVWYIFAAYALILSIAFALIFKYKHIPQQKTDEQA